MPQGLQVWDASGNLTLNTNTTAVRILGSFTTTSNTAGSVSIDTTQGTAWYQVSSPTISNYDRPTFSLSGSTLSWTATIGTAFVLYGIK